MEDECEIEYLDEDEDIVQQCVQNVPTTQTPVIESVKTVADHDIEDQIAPLLIERKRTENKRKKSEDDSDYDPSEDLEELQAQRNKRKLLERKVNKKTYPSKPIKTETVFIKMNPVQQPKSQQNKQNLNKTYENKQNLNKTYENKQNLNKTYENKLKSLPNLTVQKKSVGSQVREMKTYTRTVQKDNLAERRKLSLMIPDYEDALCLPVRAIKNDNYDVKKLKLWNSLCLENYKKADTVFKPHRGDAVKSTRSVVLRNVKNKYTGKLDTSIFGKTTVENSWAEKKSETFQGTLPKYREKKTVMNNYPLILGSQRHFKQTYVALLTKEDQKERESLVVYKPREAVSAVYTFTGEKKIKDPQDEDLPTEEKRVLKEVTCCKVCAPCYQASWRGVRKQNKQDGLQCAVCSRTFVSVYSLLCHLNTSHTAIDVGKHKAKLSKTLASLVEYHYRCRICQERFNSIKQLRKHVPKHQGVEKFKCEVGNHMAT